MTVKTYEPYENERVITFNKGSSIKELLNRIKIKSLSDYVIIINGLIIDKLSVELRQGDKITLLPNILGG